MPSEAREAWIRADQSERMLREQYQRLEADQDLTPEAKRRRAQELLETQGKKVEERRRHARETLLKHAGFAEKNVIPRPSGEALSSTSADKLLLDQNEAARIVRTVERRQDRDGPFRQSSADMLTSEYKRGLKIGGIEGGSICRGVIRAANELGVSVEEVVGPIRSDRHNESVDRARRLEYAADLISTKAPQPPRSIVGRSPRRGEGGANLHTHRIAPALLGGECEVIPQETRRRGSARAKK